MRCELLSTLVLAALSIPVALAADDPVSKPAASQSPPARVTEATEAPTSSKPPRSRPRNPVDRSRADPGVATFKSFDVNNDGYVSREEARESPELTRRFAGLDKDRDGRLSLRELTGWRDLSYKQATPQAISK